MNEKLLRYLLEQQLLTAEQADELRRAQEETNKSIRELILERAILPEEQVIEALSSLTRTPVVHLYEMTIPMDVRQAVRPDILRTYTMMPFQFDPEDSGTLYVAMNEPMNMKGRDMVAIASKCRIKPFLATTSDILVTIDRCYGSEEMQEAAELYTQTNERESASLEDQVFQEDVNASPVVVLVNSLVEQAVRQRASDIHVESGPDKVRVRCRVDGVLYTTATYDLQLLPAIIARIKILSNLDISEKRRPQDGRFSILVDRREYDVRVSTLPTVYGEKCVMRLTQKKALRRSKRALGLTGSGGGEPSQPDAESAVPASRPESGGKTDAAPETPDAAAAGEKSEQSAESSYQKELSALIAKVYVLREEYTLALDTMYADAKAEYLALPAEKRTTTQLAKMAKGYLSRANALEKECDGKMDEVIRAMETLIRDNNGDLTLVDTVVYTYANEKSLKKSWYMTKLEQKGLL